jgi:phosphohistidine phosphatase
VILYLIRHGEALPSGGSILSDADRPLSGRGEEDARMLGRLLSRTAPAISAILSSPLLRAQQTSGLIREALAGVPAVTVSEHLAPGFRSRTLYEELLRNGESATIVCVGHQPDIGNFIAYLIDVPPHGAVAMPAGAIARVAVGGGNPPEDSQLEWLLTPALLRGLTL